MAGDGSRARRRMARRMWEVTGKRIGILHNGRENGEAIAREAARCYVERHECELADVQRKLAPGDPLTQGELEHWQGRCDFLILAVGDSADSAERLIEDALLCEQLGKPALAVVTKPFKALANATALRHGILNYPLIPVDDPVRGCSAEQVTERGLLVYRQGWATLTGIYKMTV